ncbi:hypothetical protein PRIPAC_92488 [Pristionchus pacificus]|uniref:C2 domain-containing protein n=1 Tax=Pristionchus pacificus TaxID=54126 RepID=A0A2A6CIN5_PRIPA|nr:hypothetical protein PRIPAC_92488 [Pristionchus pacificus]|eukprot:PDM77938.1 hypothetical protein PRIPAC_34805 [Pristionchus pacificus]
MRPLLLLLAAAAAAVASTVQHEGFWITAELLRVDWKEGCLTTGGCSHPRFKIVKEIQSMKEKVSISWPVSEHFVQESSRQFVSHWSSGIPDEVTLSCQITGNDPVYAFPRVCDQTSASKPFRGANSDDVFGRYRRHDGLVVETIDADDRKKVIEVRGRCFNATLVVQKHTERCPWCPDPAALSVIANELPEEAQISSASALLGLSDSQLLQAGVFGLALLTVIVTGLLFCFVVAYCRQKSTLKKRSVSVKPRHTYIYQQEDERRYDAPWEQAGRPLTYGLFSNSNSCTKSETNTTTSPLDSSSSIGFYSHRALVPPPSTRIYHQIGSPNSTSTLGGSPHDDSGLESV